MEFKRDKYLQMLIARKHNGLIKVVTGLRRSGKSYLLNNLYYENLIQSGVSPDRIIKFAFDSAESLAMIGEDYIGVIGMKQKVSAKKFMAYISQNTSDMGEYYLLLDEVQYLECFEAVLNSFLYKSNFDVYVTGSNSRFLSTDVITEFRGRGDEVHLYPLSFSELYDVIGSDKDNLFNDYRVYGGLPIVVNMQSDEQKNAYLKSLIQNVYLKDVVERYNIKDYENTSDLLNVIASNISCLTNPSKLSSSFTSSKKAKIAPYTIDKHISYFCESFLVSKALRYDVKGKKYINTPYKLYFEDIGLRNAKLDFRQIEPTHLMENIIYNELKYRGYSVDVGVVENRGREGENIVRSPLEVDFIANMGSKRYYIQSAYSLQGEEKWKQEIKSLDKINDSFKKIIIVNESLMPNRLENGYVIMGVKEFLLNPDSLEY